MPHNVTVRPGIVGPGEPGKRTFESNYVVECDCGWTMQCATLDPASAGRTAQDHLRRTERLD